MENERHKRKAVDSDHETGSDRQSQKGNNKQTEMYRQRQIDGNKGLAMFA